MISAVEQLADDLRALADQPVQPEELADPLRRRQPDHQHPVGDLDAAEPAARGSPRRRGTGPARPARTRSRRRRARARPPTTRAPRPASASGPSRSHSQPHTKLIAIATSVSDEQDEVGCRRRSAPSASAVTTLMTTMTVLTASRVEEPADEEPTEARHLARVRDRSPQLAERRRGCRRTVTAGSSGAPRLADDEEDRDREDAGTARPRAGSGRRPGRRGGRSAARRRPSRSSRSPSRSRTACRASPGS